MHPDHCRFLEQITPAALDAALADWPQRHPAGGVLALLAESDKDRLPLLQSACRARGLPLTGAIFPALVAQGGFSPCGLWLLRYDVMPPYALVAGLHTQAEDGIAPAEAIRNVVEARLNAHPATLFMIFDAMVPDIASILDTLYLGLADRVRYMGVNAGSETFQPMPCLFDVDRVLGDGVLCLLLPDDRGAALEHGYLAPHEPVTATATEGNRIMTIDWRPAFDVYSERVRRYYGVELTRDNFYQYGVHFPFGIQLASGDLIVRIPVALQDDGSLFCVGEVPANAVLTLLQAPAVDSVHSMDRLQGALRQQFGPLAGRDLLTFYCAGRRMHLGEAAADELAVLKNLTGVAQLAGALSLGEIGNLSDWGYPQFHNATLVCRPWCGQP
jgi:hypothetical protein